VPSAPHLLVVFACRFRIAAQDQFSEDRCEQRTFGLDCGFLHTAKAKRANDDFRHPAGRIMRTCRYLLLLFSLVLTGLPLLKEGFSPVARAAGESPKDVLAAQIRSQGIACESPKQAVRDAKRSRPDYDVWILTCANATYRVSRYPDLAAKVERLR